MNARISSVGNNGDSVAIYFESDLGKFRLTVSDSLLVTVDTVIGQDNFGDRYDWVDTQSVKLMVESALLREANS